MTMTKRLTPAKGGFLYELSLDDPNDPCVPVDKPYIRLPYIFPIKPPSRSLDSSSNGI